MKSTTARRLLDLGLDVEFLSWLEGKAERLPRRDRIGRISGPKYVAAVRAAVWLASLMADPECRGELSEEEWRTKYDALQALLWNAIRLSMWGHRRDRPEDLATLEGVLEQILPESQVESYRQDIRRLRRLGKPERLRDWVSAPKPRRSGGSRQSEQVQRTRAAVEYLKSASRTPFRDLAQLWNERLGQDRYLADDIRQQLRKGPQDGAQLLDFWRRIYMGEGWLAFPGKAPSSGSGSPSDRRDSEEES